MKINRCKYLLEKYQNGKCTNAERSELLELISLPEMETSLKEEIDKFILEISSNENGISSLMTAEEADRIYDAIIQKREEKPEYSIVRTMSWLKYAAAILLLIVVGGFFYWKNQQNSLPDSLALQSDIDIEPGMNGAILTLADGSMIVLDSLKDGVVAKEHGVIATLEYGALNYNVNQTNHNETGYNTITTPKGRQFQLTLSDGTRVWLNAGSSIKYPTIFNKNVRKVSIAGEAYFEVAHQTKVPFYVEVNNELQVKVLGTHFNINAYSNEDAISTTLLEGSILVSKKNNQADQILLKPGQQAQLKPNQNLQLVNNIEVDQVVAWKNGIFNFDDKNVEEVMRQLERWYNIEVIYENGIPNIEFWGKMQQDLTLSAVLRILERAEVKFKILENRKLIVMK